MSVTVKDEKGGSLGALKLSGSVIDGFAQIKKDPTSFFLFAGLHLEQGKWLKADSSENALSLSKLGLTEDTPLTIYSRYQLVPISCEGNCLDVVLDVALPFAEQLPIWLMDFQVQNPESYILDINGLPKTTECFIDGSVNVNHPISLVKKDISFEFPKGIMELPVWGSNTSPNELGGAAMYRRHKKFENRKLFLKGDVLTILKEKGDEVDGKPLLLSELNLTEHSPDPSLVRKRRKGKEVGARALWHIDLNEEFHFQFEMPHALLLKWQQKIVPQCKSINFLSPEVFASYKEAHPDTEEQTNQYLFSVPFAKTLYSGELIPRLVVQCCEYVRERGMKLEGIFRLSGSQTQIDVYRRMLDLGIPVPINEEENPHTIAGLVKLFFREMPVPLMTFALYNSIIQAQKSPDENLRRRFIRRFLRDSLPLPNFHTLKYLCYFMREVSTFSSVNKMAAPNLAVVFAPNLVKTDVNNVIAMVQHSPQINSFVVSLIEEADYFFSEILYISPQYDYKAQSENELSFTANTVLTVVEEGTESGWWKAERSDGQVGLVPGSYVKLLLPAADPFGLLPGKLVEEKLKEKKEVLEQLTARKESITNSLKSFEGSLDTTTLKAVASDGNLPKLITSVKQELKKLGGLKDNFTKVEANLTSLSEELHSCYENWQSDAKSKKKSLPLLSLILKMDTAIAQFPLAKNKVHYFQMSSAYQEVVTHLDFLSLTLK
eukprot:TRINITY_DN2674_c0_g1_i1.p1 TRINITY_DN2674_c0_g1~~TRINITY_DN2674_c0_g1_i1.p1  ORF type:complete len:729 (-),score=185.24 TRINITY_DN2674_c0_g1_i1:161-2311(-)